MKKKVVLLLLGVAVIGIVSYSRHASPVSLFYYSPCDTPIPYTVDSVDSRFHVSKDEFRSDIEEAADIWSSVYGKKLFTYSSENSLSINLVYDNRQYLTNQINQMEGQLDTDKNSIQSRLQEYEQEAAQFKQRLFQLNAEISDWNKKGGAPQDVYERLTQEQQDLKAEAEKLNALARTVNRSTDSYNAQVGDLNQTIQSFNNELHLKPEEGLYNPKDNRIEIYFNNNRAELVHTLAHELGHSLGIDHNKNQASIMYPYTTQKTTLSTDDFASLQVVCQKRTIFELLAKRLIIILQYLGKRASQNQTGN